jgi:hypothetical protein
MTSHIPAQAEEGQKAEYDDESDSYQNDDNPDETTNQDGSQIFGDTKSVNRPDIKQGISDSNNRKGSNLSSTSRIPFVSSNLWRDLFSKPGILVGKIYLKIFFFKINLSIQVLSVVLLLVCYPQYYLLCL